MGPVLLFSMAEPGHVHRLLPLARGLAARGTEVHAFTDAAFRKPVEGAGAVFHDLFAGRPLAAADVACLPVPSRLVSFAGRFGDAVAADAAALRPSLVVHDTFAVVGRVVAGRLGVPRVNVCAGHDVRPDRFLEALAQDPRVRVAPECHEAVEVLRTRHGLADASPFSYVDGLSRDLNVYCEPPQFLDDEARRAFEPVAFFGSLPADPGAPRNGRARPGPLRVYASFGTVVWRYYAPEARAALAALADAFASVHGLSSVLALGRAPVDAAALARPNVAVEPYVDQWSVLAGTDVFVTHHGLNSTHEAIWHGVPMLSYPFFWDQPALAAKCRDFGLAVPLADAPRGPLAPDGVRAALEDLCGRWASLEEALSRARSWERAVVGGRGAVIDRILALRRPRTPPQHHF